MRALFDERLLQDGLLLRREGGPKGQHRFADSASQRRVVRGWGLEPLRIVEIVNRNRVPGPPTLRPQQLATAIGRDHPKPGSERSAVHVEVGLHAVHHQPNFLRRFLLLEGASKEPTDPSSNLSVSRSIHVDEGRPIASCEANEQLGGLAVLKWQWPHGLVLGLGLCRRREEGQPFHRFVLPKSPGIPGGMNPNRTTLALTLVLAACGKPTFDPGQLMANALTSCPDCPPTGYAPSDAGEGFVVHEWGTLTSVLGSDGLLLPGLHHEEEDLPGFVADRVSQVGAYPFTNTFQKMETPVTYFYSAEPMTAAVSVRFRDGLLTQWFPWVQRVAPPVYERDGVVTDAWLSSSMSLPQSCSANFTRPFSEASSTLDWGDVRVLARDARPELAGPIGDSTWGFARNVASNPLEVVSPDGTSKQHERFLFYRGLGDFQLPVTATVRSQRCAPDIVTFVNAGAAPAGRVLLMHVTTSGAAFVEVGDVGAQPVEASVSEQLQPLPEFVTALKAKLMENLVADGLYTDEAKAMVDTWERSYFLTPGLRALYLLPQAETDALIPLSITPAPKELKRTMVIRLELLSPTVEVGLSSVLARLPFDPLARAEVMALGRFAEPHLTRAIGLSNSKVERAAGEELLREIRGVRRWAPVIAQ